MAVSRVKSIATRRFWELFRALPPEVQNLASRIITCGDGTLISPGKRRSLKHSRRRSLSRPRQANGREDDLGLDRHALRLRPPGRLMSVKSAMATTQADVLTLTVCGALLFVPQCFHRRHASGPACRRIRGKQSECHHHCRAKDDRDCALRSEE